MEGLLSDYVCGRVVRVLNYDEFEVEMDVKIGDFVKVGDLIAVVYSIYEEEPEYIKYLGDIEKEELKKFAPDLIKERKIARCLILCKEDLEEARYPPRIGDKVEKISEFELRKLHFKGGELKIPYLINLIRKTRDVGLVRSIIVRLMRLIPEEYDLLEILLAEIEYSRMRGVSLE